MCDYPNIASPNGFLQCFHFGATTKHARLRMPGRPSTRQLDGLWQMLLVAPADHIPQQHVFNVGVEMKQKSLFFQIVPTLSNPCFPSALLVPQCPPCLVHLGITPHINFCKKSSSGCQVLCWHAQTKQLVEQDIFCNIRIFCHGMSAFKPNRKRSISCGGGRSTPIIPLKRPAVFLTCKGY